MKDMVTKLVDEVRMEKSNRRIAAPTKPVSAKKKRASNKAPTATIMKEQICPKCRKGNLLKGNSAYGCSQYKEGCTFRLPFKFMSKKIPEKQLLRLFKKGSTINLKGFKENGESKEGLIRFNQNQELVFEIKKGKTAAKKAAVKDDTPSCPKCKKGKIIKGKTAYGCSNWQKGCDFRFPFDEIFKKAEGKKLTKELVYQILSE